MFYLGGVGLASFLSILLLSKSKKSVADRILTCWLLIITVHLLLFYFWKVSVYPELLGVAIPFPLLHGPLLYLYTRALTNQTAPLKVAGLHFIPFVTALVYLVPFLAQPSGQKLMVFENEGAGYETFNQIMSLSTIASGVVYVTLSGIALRKHRISITEQFSNIEKINLVWLQYLIYWIGVIWLLVIFANDDWVFGAAVLFILFIGFFGIRQVGVFHSQHVPENKEKIMSNGVRAENEKADTGLLSVQERRKYEKSGLSEEGSARLHHQLTQVMHEQRLYRECELSLSELASRLNTQPNYLSQVINEREGKSFYDYINTLRIEEFKYLAGSPDCRKYTLMALAEQCGFNSKSTFNRYFKKVTGQSPSEFVQAALDSEK